MENSKKILLVEDDDSLGYLLTEYLKMKGFSVNCTSDTRHPTSDNKLVSVT